MPQFMRSSTPPVPYRAAVVVLATSVAALVTGCSASHPISAASHTAVRSFTCCVSRDTDRIYHPGDIVAIHWISATTYADTTAPVPVTLTASLDGGFAGATDLKSGQEGTGGQISAQPVHVTDQTTTAPVSRLRIPPHATPGLYNLVTAISESGGEASEASIIRVE